MTVDHNWVVHHNWVVDHNWVDHNPTVDHFSTIFHNSTVDHNSIVDEHEHPENGSKSPRYLDLNNWNRSTTLWEWSLLPTRSKVVKGVLKMVIIGILNDISTYLSSLECLHEIQNQIRKYDNDLSGAKLVRWEFSKCNFCLQSDLLSWVDSLTATCQKKKINITSTLLLSIFLVILFRCNCVWISCENDNILDKLPSSCVDSKFHSITLWQLNLFRIFNLVQKVYKVPKVPKKS